MSIEKEFDIKVAAHFVRAICTNILHGPESDEVKERWNRLHSFVHFSGKNCSAHLDWQGHELDTVDDLVELIEDHVETLDFVKPFFDQIDAWEAMQYLTVADEETSFHRSLVALQEANSYLGFADNHIQIFEKKWLYKLGLMLLNLTAFSGDEQ